jgi:hypothetical protein
MKNAPDRKIRGIFLCLTQIHCGSELARDEAITFSINVEWKSAIASKLAPTRDLRCQFFRQAIKNAPDREARGVFVSGERVTSL